VQATVDALNTYRMFGLSNGDSNTLHGDIDFAAYLAGSTLMVYERGLNKGTFGTLAVGDVIKVSIESGVVKYYKNDALFYTSSAPARYPLLLDTAINSTLGQISNAYICSADLGPIIATPSPIPTAITSSTPPGTSTATGTHTRTPTSTPQPGACMGFPPDNIWNRNIAAIPTSVRSNNYVASIGGSTQLHTGFAAGLWHEQTLGMPYVSVPGTQPLVPITFLYDDQSDPGPYPVPTNAPIEQNDSTDRHVLVVNRGTCMLYEVFHANPHADGSWDGDSGAVWNLNSNALRPDGWTSADAAGLPILPGLVRYDEVASGVIRHALRFTAPTIRDTWVWPARHTDGNSTDLNAPPMGTRFRLKAAVDISGYPAQLRVVLQAMKDYGMFLADSGMAWNVDGVPDDRWDNDVLHMIGNLHGSDLEAVDESSLMIDPNSGQSR
jgi:hypothetical protein